LRFEFLVIGPELLDSLPGGSNVEVSDIQANYITTNPAQYCGDQQQPAPLGPQQTIQSRSDRLP
jgi:hypothetical protein